MRTVYRTIIILLTGSILNCLSCINDNCHQTGSWCDGNSVMHCYKEHQGPLSESYEEGPYDYCGSGWDCHEWNDGYASCIPTDICSSSIPVCSDYNLVDCDPEESKPRLRHCKQGMTCVEGWAGAVCAFHGSDCDTTGQKTCADRSKSRYIHICRDGAWADYEICPAGTVCVEAMYGEVDCQLKPHYEPKR